MTSAQLLVELGRNTSVVYKLATMYSTLSTVHVKSGNTLGNLWLTFSVLTFAVHTRLRFNPNTFSPHFRISMGVGIKLERTFQICQQTKWKSKDKKFRNRLFVEVLKILPTTFKYI